MYKNQLQELAQRSCFNLPSYACIREGPDHAPRFKASVNFHGEIFEGPSYCLTLRQAEHAAAEVALNNLSTRGTSRSLAARVLDETGVYKNLLQETAHRAGLKLPVYTTVRSGPGHQPVFTCSVELAGMSFNGEPAKTKKQAEKNAAMAAWSALKQMPNLDSLQSKEIESGEDMEQVVVARVLSSFKPKEENKSMRQRDQLQKRRTAHSPYNASGFRHQWRFNDPVSDSSTIYLSQLQQRHRGFLSLPPPNGPKILPPLPLLQQISTTKDPPPSFEYRKEQDDWINEISDVKGKSIAKDHFISKPTQVFWQRNLLPSARLTPPPLKECQKEEEDWINEISDAKGKSIAKDSFILKTTQMFGPRNLLPSARPIPPPLEECKKEEEDWINVISDAKGKSIVKDPFILKPTQLSGPKNLLLAAKSIPSPLEKCQREENDWINEILDAKGQCIAKDSFISKPTQAFGPRPCYQRAFSIPYQRTQQSHRPFSPPPHFHPPTQNFPGSPIPRTMSSGGFHGIAPAVHVRSVVPVCAVPPPRPPPNTSGVLKKEAEEDISATTSKLSKIQL